MCGSRKFCQMGSNSDKVFFFFFGGGGGLVDEEIEVQAATKTGHYRPYSETPLKWRFADRPMMVQH